MTTGLNAGVVTGRCPTHRSNRGVLALDVFEGGLRVRSGRFPLQPSCCANAISLPALASFYLVPSDGRRSARLAESKDFVWLVARIRSGPPIGFFRIGWVRSVANLNEFFVHHEDVRRANWLGPRSLTPAMDAALWRNVRRGSHYLSRRLEACGLEIQWAGTDHRVTVRPGEPTAGLSGAPGELLLYVFGRQDAAQVEVSGPPQAVAAVRRTHFGM
jgi:uncharacterized protein (TIGR03085 family)